MTSWPWNRLVEAAASTVQQPAESLEGVETATSAALAMAVVLQGATGVVIAAEGAGTPPNEALDRRAEAVARMLSVELGRHVPVASLWFDTVTRRLTRPGQRTAFRHDDELARLIRSAGRDLG